MKRLNKIKAVFSVFFAVCLFSTCDQIGGDYVNKPKELSDLDYLNASVNNTAVVSLTENAGGNYNPVSFKTGLDDSADAKIEASFRIGKTAVTKELWTKVYDWATDVNRAIEENRQAYKFSAKAYKGAIKVEKEHPVTEITYLDAAVWCNALTEYLNYLHKDKKGWVDLYPVYYTKDSEEAFKAFFRTDSNGRRKYYFEAEEGVEALHKRILRVSGDPDLNSEGLEFTEYCGFNGYRLPTNNEWEFAARLTTVSTNAVPSLTFTMEGTSYFFTKGNSLSGAEYVWNDPVHGAEENAKFGVFGIPGAGGTAGITEAVKVKTKQANSLGCFDMSGNVWEWTLPEKERRIVLKTEKLLNDDYPYANPNGNGRRKGGSILSLNAQELCVGFDGTFPMKKDDTDKSKWAKKEIGFRIAKTVKAPF